MTNKAINNHRSLDALYNNAHNDNYITRHTPNINQFSNYSISPNNVRKWLCLLPNKYNNSPDGLPKAILKKIIL